MSIGENIARFRKLKGWTQAELGEKIGVSNQAVSKWESGSSDPSTTNLLALAKLYGICAEELLRSIKQ